MNPRKEKRYKALGIALVVFILLAVFAVLRPKPGLSDVFAKENKTDSIRIYCISKKTVITVSDSIEIRQIIAGLKKATPYDPVALKIDREIFDLKFYSGKSNNDVSFLRGDQDGRMIWVGLAGFKVDTMLSSITS